MPSMKPGQKLPFKILVLSVLGTCLLFSPPAVQAKEPGTVMEDFTLYGYGEDEGELSWELSGERGEQQSDGLVVFGFQLKLKRSDELVSLLSGEKLRLDASGEEKVAHVPGRAELKIGDQLKGTANEISYYFSGGRLTGEDLSLTETRESGKVTLEGTGFSYDYKTEEINVSEGFKLIGHDSNGDRTEISGGELTWPPEGRIEMVGEVEATLASGWKLEADRMVWDPEESLLESSGSASAAREGTEISGTAINYGGEEEKIDAVDGLMVIEDD
ncbi:MAG: hypothetical protein ACLFSX_05300 [Candidatus Acetothermia bacterium]